MRRDPLADGLVGRSERRRLIEIPRLELPAGIAATRVLEGDLQVAGQVERLSIGAVLGAARGQLRLARRAQRRARARPAAKAGKRSGDLERADRGLVTAGVLCGIVELMRADLTVFPERVARLRERCVERLGEERSRFAIDVENWIRDLAGEDRLSRG